MKPLKSGSFWDQEIFMSFMSKALVAGVQRAEY